MIDKVTLWILDRFLHDTKKGNGTRFDSAKKDQVSGDKKHVRKYHLRDHGYFDGDYVQVLLMIKLSYLDCY